MRKRRLFLEALEKRLVLSGVGQPDADQSGPDWQSVIVSFKDDVGDTRAAASALMQSVGGQVGHVYEHALTGFSAYLPAAAVKGLSNNPLVQSIEPNQVVQACGAWPAGTPYVVPHGVDRIDADLPIDPDDPDSPQDWSSVDVAIIDTGIDRDHPDLNVKTNEDGEVGVHFYTRLTGPPSKRGIAIEDDNFDDDSGHGSHVAGIVGALDNDKGVVGVAPGATLWGVKVLDSRGYGTVADVIAGVNWVVERAADIEVINMSLGLQGPSPALRTAIQGAVAAGIVVVVAAGNDTQDVYGPDRDFDTADDFIPAAYPEVITISAMVETDGIPGGFGPLSGSGPDDSFAGFSNYSAGGAIDLVLPGVNLWSTWWDGSNVQLSGTSMAAPHAAGLAARYIAENHIDKDWYRNGYIVDVDEAYDVSCDYDNDGDNDLADYVDAVRRALIDNAIAQGDPRGLEENDPYGNPEPIGWAVPSDMDEYPPAVSVTEPVAGAKVFGLVTLEAIVFNEDGPVGQVEFLAASWPDGDHTWIGSGESNDGVSWNSSWDTTDTIRFPDGLYEITATATEGDQSGSSSPIFVTVENGTVSGATMYVKDLDESTMSIGQSGKWQALVDVWIVDAVGVSEATVFGTWSGAATGSVSGLTGSDGIVKFISGTIFISESVTFTVTNVSHSEFEYVPGDNLETQIVISPPSTRARSLTTAVEADSLEAMYHYLAGTAHLNKQSGKKDADQQAVAIDLLMAYGL